jgi:hypothetical protein
MVSRHRIIAITLFKIMELMITKEILEDFKWRNVRSVEWKLQNRLRPGSSLPKGGNLLASVYTSAQVAVPSSELQ